MKIDQLKALDAVVRSGSFAKAANEILLVTQPAVTRAINNLEKSIGYKVLSREKYRPELTPKGKVFYEKSLHILEEIENLRNFNSQVANGIEPVLFISIDAYILLPNLLKAFHKINEEYPVTQLNISLELLGGSLRKILSKEADLGLLLWVKEYERFKNLETKLVKKIKISTVVAPDFPLLKKTGTVSKKDLAPYIQVIERTDPLHQPAADIDKNFCHNWYVSNIHAKKQIILSGRSFGLIPHHIIEYELEKGLLVPFENMEGYQVYERELKIAHLKNRETGVVFNKLWEKIGNNN